MEYRDLVQSDLELVFILQDWFESHPLVSRALSRVTSKYPWKDICRRNSIYPGLHRPLSDILAGLIIWALALYGCFELGLIHFYMFTINILIVTGNALLH